MSYHDLNSGLIVNSQRNMLNEENTVTDALKWMEAEEVEHLIVISGQYFNKLISIEDLENQKKKIQSQNETYQSFLCSSSSQKYR